MTPVDLPQLAPRLSTIDLTRYNVPIATPFVCDIVAQPTQTSRAVAHVSNIEFVRWLDRAAELHADSLGYPRQSMLSLGIMWFVARHEIDYLAEVWPHDELVIATWVRDIRKVKSWRDYVIVRPSDQTVVCRAATLWVLVNLETRRPIRISDEMAQRFLAQSP